LATSNWIGLHGHPFCAQWNWVWPWEIGCVHRPCGVGEKCGFCMGRLSSSV